MRTTVIAPQDSVVLMRWVIAGAVIMIGASHVQYALSGPHSWTFLGLAIGVVLDAIRRAGYQARRRLIDVETFVRDADDPSLQDPRETVLRGEPLNPFTCPLLPSVAARVFISYTRSSAKGSRLASALHDELRQAGASPFLDRATIPIGSSWRRSLNQHIGECDSIICILDEKGVQRKWVAAELLAAIEARRLTGTPYIVILMDPKVDRSTLGMLPVFRGVATAATEPPVQGRPLITQLNKQTLTSLVWGFAPGRFVPTAVLTRTLALSVRFVQSAMGFVGGFGILAGYVLGFLVLLERMGRFPVVKGLLDRGWLEPLTILVGFWLGFTARAAIAWGWESTHDSESGKTIPTIATIGLAFTFILLVPKTSIFVALWSTILVLVGWMLVGSVVGMTKDKNARVPRQA
jgi:hypothetical protein